MTVTPFDWALLPAAPLKHVVRLFSFLGGYLVGVVNQSGTQWLNLLECSFNFKIGNNGAKIFHDGIMFKVCAKIRFFIYFHGDNRLILLTW